MPNWNTYVQGLFMKCLREKAWKPAQISDWKTPWRLLSQDRSERQLTNNYNNKASRPTSSSIYFRVTLEVFFCTFYIHMSFPYDS